MLGDEPMILALSTAAGWAAVATVLVFAVVMRLLGRWLIRKGGSIEAARHGPLPGVTPDPAESRATREAEPPADDRYDPFDAG
jgi:hypothetical protein